MNNCLNCGHDAGDDNPQPRHCGECPPWTCEVCGQLCSAAELCSCWIPLEGMVLADLKAVFAGVDLSLEIQGPAVGAPEEAEK